MDDAKDYIDCVSCEGSCIKVQYNDRENFVCQQFMQHRYEEDQEKSDIDAGQILVEFCDICDMYYDKEVLLSEGDDVYYDKNGHDHRTETLTNCRTCGNSMYKCETLCNECEDCCVKVPCDSYDSMICKEEIEYMIDYQKDNRENFEKGDKVLEYCHFCCMYYNKIVSEGGDKYYTKFDDNEHNHHKSSDIFFCKKLGTYTNIKVVGEESEKITMETPPKIKSRFGPVVFYDI